jgi:hypothetical protein
MPAQTDEPTGSSFEAPSPEVRATTGECKGLKIPVSCRFSKGRDPSSLSFSEPWDPRPGGFAEAFPPHVTPRYVPVRPALGGSPPAMMDSVTGPPHSAAPGSDRAYAPSERLSGRDDTDCQGRLPLAATGPHGVAFGIVLAAVLPQRGRRRPRQVCLEDPDPRVR